MLALYLLQSILELKAIMFWSISNKSISKMDDCLWHLKRMYEMRVTREIQSGIFLKEIYDWGGENIP